MSIALTSAAKHHLQPATTHGVISRTDEKSVPLVTVANAVLP